ncbi:MAG: hypothetical protein LBO72_04465 [Helicobacteraceae bacterium]|jgi:hypothetical protein|nr:hypothetical protein [Helicobacteraceae bacterium]
MRLDKPVIITTSNGNPIKHYGLNIIGKREIYYENISDYKNDISKTSGLYKGKSTDFDIIIKAFFGILPWDCFYKDNYIDEYLIEGVKRRNDTKCLKDFSIEELKKLLPDRSIKLQRIINKNNGLRDNSA